MKYKLRAIIMTVLLILFWVFYHIECKVWLKGMDLLSDSLEVLRICLLIIAGITAISLLVTAKRWSKPFLAVAAAGLCIIQVVGIKCFPDTRVSVTASMPVLNKEIGTDSLGIEVPTSDFTSTMWLTCSESVYNYVEVNPSVQYVMEYRFLSSNQEHGYLIRIDLGSDVNQESSLL